MHTIKETKELLKYDVKSNAPSNEELRYIMSTLYYIPQDYKKYIATYYTRHWTAFHTLSLIKEGTLCYQGVTYQVLYYKTDPLSLARREDHAFVKISFRVAHKSFNVLPVALIQENKGVN